MAKKIHFKLDQNSKDFEIKDNVPESKPKGRAQRPTSDNMVIPSPFQASKVALKKINSPTQILNTANSNLPIFGRPIAPSKRIALLRTIDQITNSLPFKTVNKAGGRIWSKYKLQITGTLILIAFVTIILSVLAAVNPSFFGTVTQTSSTTSSSTYNEQRPRQESQKSQPVFEQDQYVELVKPQGIQATSVNIRDGACSDKVIGAQNWSALGRIIEGPVQKDCFDDTWQWYRVMWSNGQIGWSIADYFQKVDAERNYTNQVYPDLKIKFDINWQLEEQNQSGVSTVTLQNSATTIKITIGQSQNASSPLACYAQTASINDETQSYRLFRGARKEGSDTFNYYDYLNRESFVLRTQDDFDPLYQNYLKQYRPQVNLEEPGKLPFFDLYMVDSCALQTYYGTTSSSQTSLGSTNSRRNQAPVSIEVRVKNGGDLTQRLGEADDIIKNISGIDRLNG